MEDKWINVESMLPQQAQLVETKVDDNNGVRKEQKLKLIFNLWFSIGSYPAIVNYTPTHWKPIK